VQLGKDPALNAYLSGWLNEGFRRYTADPADLAREDAATREVIARQWLDEHPPQMQQEYDALARATLIRAGRDEVITVEEAAGRTQLHQALTEPIATGTQLLTTLSAQPDVEPERLAHAINAYHTSLQHLEQIAQAAITSCQRARMIAPPPRPVKAQLSDPSHQATGTDPRPDHKP